MLSAATACAPKRADAVCFIQEEVCLQTLFRVSLYEKSCMNIISYYLKWSRPDCVHSLNTSNWTAQYALSISYSDKHQLMS